MWGVEEKLACWDHLACLHGYRDWGGLVVDVGTELVGTAMISAPAP